MQLQRLLFEPTLLRSPLRVVQWWESRRLAFNAVVGFSGLVTLAASNVIELTFGNGWFPVPWQVIVAYGLAANVCYTAGCVVENAVESVVPDGGRLLSNSFTLAAATSVLAFMLQLDQEPDEARRNIRRRVLFLGISVTAMTVLFTPAAAILLTLSWAEEASWLPVNTTLMLTLVRRSASNGSQ